MKPHKHAEFIKAWADGAQIETMTAIGWQAIGDSPSWAECNEYRVKPAESERVYPQTTMTDRELEHFAYRDGTRCVDDCRDAANAALRHAIDQRHVFAKEDVKQAVDSVMALYNAAKADRAARDMAIAKEVVKSLCWVLEPANKDRFNEEYLLPVIARAKP